jgi:hypothetical protein
MGIPGKGHRRYCGLGESWIAISIEDSIITRGVLGEGLWKLEDCG